MAKTQDLKRRIRSVRNTMQLTRAMKMVAAAKLRRSQERIMSARPYSHRVQRVLRSLAARANPEVHPLLRQSDQQKVEIVVVTSDRGLCGAFNAGILRTAESFVATKSGSSLTISTIGKKGRDYFARRGELSRQWSDVFRQIEYSTAKAIAADIMERFVDQKVDTFYLVYNEFKSAIQSKPTVMQLLPIERATFERGDVVEDYIYEPSALELFGALLPHYVESQIFHSLLESVAAEHAARMAAMDSATKNAGELIESLTLTMNRVRQASITTEIIEVVSGAEALG